MSRILFITGIDTGVGKSYVTGLWARQLRAAGARVITAKLVQTGSASPAEDILLHRRLMGIPLQPEDAQGLTCPYVFPYPASPHLSSRLAATPISPARLDHMLLALGNRFDWVLLEGAGGICVPLTPNYTVLDFVKTHGLPCVLVSSPKLGSINHTLLSVRQLRQYGLPLPALVYNEAMDAPPEIREDSFDFFTRYLAPLPVLSLPPVDAGRPPVLQAFVELTRLTSS